MGSNVIERAKQTAKNADIYLMDMNEVVGTPERPTYQKVTPPEGPPIYKMRDTRSMMIKMMGIAHDNERNFVETDRLRMAQRNLGGNFSGRRTSGMLNTSSRANVSPIKYVSASGVTHSLPRDNMDTGDIDISDALDDDGGSITWSDQEDEGSEPGRASRASTPLVPMEATRRVKMCQVDLRMMALRMSGELAKRRKTASVRDSSPAENDIIVEEVMQVGSEICLYRFEEKIFQTWGISGPFG